MHAPSKATANSAASPHLTLRVQCEAHDCGALLEVIPDAALFLADANVCMRGQGECQVVDLGAKLLAHSQKPALDSMPATEAAVSAA